MAAAIEERETTGGLGGAATATPISGVALNNIYDDVDAAEAAAGDTEYRAIDLFNTGDATAVTVTAHMSVPTSSADTQLDFGIEASPINSTLSIADESTAPAGVSFANYTPASKLAIDDIPNGSYARLWLRRVVQPLAANTANDQGTIRTEFA